MRSDKMKCCFCGKECGEYGNNPYPLSENENDRCCDECNCKVIEARINAMLEAKRNEAKN